MSLEDMDTLQAKIDGKTNTTSRTKTNWRPRSGGARSKYQGCAGYRSADSKCLATKPRPLEQTRKEIEKQSRGIQLALGRHWRGEPFLVAAIGIANTMIMSVSERHFGKSAL